MRYATHFRKLNCVTSYIPKKDKTIEKDITGMVARNWGWEKRLTLKGHDKTFWSDRNFLCFNGGDGYLTLCVYQNSQNAKKNEFYHMSVIFQ